MTSLVERHAAKIVGTLSCYDRVIIQGTLPGVGYAAGMTGYLKARGLRIFDFAEFTKPLTQAIRENAQRIADEHGLEIEYIRSPRLLRKEDRIAEVLAERGDHPGLVHIFSAMETCSTFAPWHDKKMGKTFLRRARAALDELLERRQTPIAESFVAADRAVRREETLRDACRSLLLRAREGSAGGRWATSW
jgi:hypothetical protein